MTVQKNKMFWIKIPYWVGIGADALWAVGLLFPPVYGVLTGNPGFNPDVEIRLIMGIGGSLMAGWTILLIWALGKPIERRGVILITAFPVVLGLLIVSLIGLLGGNPSNIWLIAKTTLLMILTINSYVKAGKIKN